MPVRAAPRDEKPGEAGGRRYCDATAAPPWRRFGRFRPRRDRIQPALDRAFRIAIC
jgi:hypothetical protein